MGNSLFLTPLVQRLRELLPHASIDIASAYPKAGDLFEPMPGVRRVIVFPYKGVELAWRYLAALRRVRRERYDLAIDPALDSTSDRIVLLLARARYRLGFASASQWAPLTHAAPMPDGNLHQAALPVHLLDQVIGSDRSSRSVALGLSLEAEELAAGRAAVERAIAAHGGVSSARPVLGFFAHATGHKTIAREFWRALLDAFLELEPEAVALEVLPSPGATPTDTRCATLYCASPRALAAAMASMRLFVCGDTGPMHLASATAVPTVALFHASEVALYGPLKPCDVALDLSHCTATDVARRCQQSWRASESHARLIVSASS